MRDLLSVNELAHFTRNPQMANRKVVKVMSEDRLENGESVNELPSYTLQAVHDDYDIVVDPQVMSPAFFTNLCKMAERTYKHIMSNEAWANKGIKELDGDEVAQNEALRKWRQARRELIVNGELGFRESGPRISEEDKQWKQDIIEILLKPRYKDSKPFPTSGKAMLQGKTLDDWITYCKQSEKYANIKEQAYATVAKRKADAAAAKLAAGDQSTANAFADL